MKPKSTASQWRIELTSELAKVYAAQKDVRMIVLGGSPSRNLSDAYSDVDMIVYWEQIDQAFIDNVPLKNLGGDLKVHLNMQTSQMELYYFDTLIFEVGHVTMGVWEEMVDSVLEKHQGNPMVLKSLGGFLDSIPIYGQDQVAEWKTKVKTIPDEFAVKFVERNLSFYWHGCIKNQGLKRGEVVFFYDAVCQTVKRLMAILSGLNGRYFAVYEPRWIDYELSKMSIKPDRMWERIQNLYEIDRYQALDQMEQLIREVVDLVKLHMPQVDMTQFNKWDALEIRETREKPILKPPADL